MTDPDALDDTPGDHEQFKTELIAQDRDAAQISTADIDETTARQLVNNLVDDSVVTPIPKQRVLVHGPGDEAFDSVRQLAVFHRGWTATRDAGEERDDAADACRVCVL